MKKILAVLSALTILMGSLPFQVKAEQLNGTMVRSGAADPWMCYYDGYYYLALTGSTKIAVFKSRTVSGFKSLTITSNIVYDSAQDKTVEELYGAGATLSGTWSPELHYFTESEAPGNSGWYMFLALRNNTGDSSEVQGVVLKSLSGTPKGPYGHPVTGEKNRSQVFCNADGSTYENWAIGQSVLKISEGPYSGIYTTWVTEVGRGGRGDDGTFHQKLMIAKMRNPWTIASEPGVITTPTQQWEYAGASETHPRVVEGATALYGTRGDVYITYSGSGYWSSYGIGQLTWTGGNPLLTSSWVKLPSITTSESDTCNPIFQAAPSFDLYGCGHGSFVWDKEGNGYFVYHAYPYEGGTKGKARNSYIEPYYIDYSEYNGTSYGVIHIGANDNRKPAASSTKITFANTGEGLGAPTVTAKYENEVKLSMSADNATGYVIYRSEDGKTFELLASIDGTAYTDAAVEQGKTYYYRAYATRNEELSARSEIVSIKAEKLPDTTEPIPETTSPVTDTASAPDTNSESVPTEKPDGTVALPDTATVPSETEKPADTAASTISDTAANTISDTDEVTPQGRYVLLVGATAAVLAILSVGIIIIVEKKKKKN